MEISGLGMTKVAAFLEAAGMDFMNDELRHAAPTELLQQIEVLLITRTALFQAEVGNRGYIEQVSVLAPDIQKALRMQAPSVPTPDMTLVSPGVTTLNAPVEQGYKYQTVGEIPTKDLIHASVYCAGQGISFESEVEILEFMNTQFMNIP